MQLALAGHAVSGTGLSVVATHHSTIDEAALRWLFETEEVHHAERHDGSEHGRNFGRERQQGGVASLGALAGTKLVALDDVGQDDAVQHDTGARESDNGGENAGDDWVAG